MNPKPLLRLLALTQTFLLFAVVSLPVMIRYLRYPLGRWLYGLLAAVSIGFSLFLRRALSELD